MSARAASETKAPRYASAARGKTGSAKKRAAAGYSGTPLARKLGIEAGDEVFLGEAPKDYREIVAPPDGVRFVSRLGKGTDVVHLFATERTKLEKAIRAALAKMKPDAVIWASWPKKASKVPTDITEDKIREIGLPLGLVDVKVCAVDDVWSGLKLVIRRENRLQRP